MPSEIERALATWREAERRLKHAAEVGGSGGHITRLTADVQSARAEFQRLSAEHMVERIDALHEAEARRMAAIPSTEPYHEAAKEEAEIASDIWGAARLFDKGTPTGS